MFKSLWIDGSATFTIVLSNMIMNRPNATAPSVHHFLFSGSKIFAFISPPPKLVRTKLAVAQGARTLVAHGWSRLAPGHARALTRTCPAAGGPAPIPRLLRA